MIHKRFNNQHVLRFARGESFFEPLLHFLADQDIRGGTIRGIGGAEWAELGLYDLDDKQYHWQRFDGPLEVSNLSGFITVHETEGIHAHVHATIAGRDMKAYAGHLKELEVAGTLEVAIDTTDEISRKIDNDIGLALINFDD